MGTWTDPEDGDNTVVCVAILLFSGSDSTQDVNVSVVHDGEYLDYAVRWPTALTSVEELHEKWLSGRKVRKFQIYHPMISCFRRFIALLRGRDNRVITRSRIPLPFPVESRFETHFLKFSSSSAKVLYVILRAPKVETMGDIDLQIDFD